MNTDDLLAEYYVAMIPIIDGAREIVDGLMALSPGPGVARVEGRGKNLQRALEVHQQVGEYLQLRKAD